jgi:hypothetical protein
MQRRAIQRASYMGSDDFSWEEVQIALKDPKVYLRCVRTPSLHLFCCTFANDPCSGIIQFCQDILLYGFSTFLPSIIKTMGYGTYETQVHSPA